eukprot:7086063-Pyramimonas_sp.AAC.1
MGDVARQPDGSAVARYGVRHGGFDLARPRSPRQRSRPRSTWGQCIYDLDCQAAGGQALPARPVAGSRARAAQSCQAPLLQAPV